jgi:hypothetical protein
MSRGTEIWLTAQEGTKSGDDKSANVMRMYALAQMLAEAETALLRDDLEAAALFLRDLQTYTEHMLRLLVNEHVADAA